MTPIASASAVTGTVAAAAPRLARMLARSAGRQVCLLDSSDRLTPWLALPEGSAAGAARLDISLRPVEPCEGLQSQALRPEQFDSAYDASAQLSIWMLRKRPQEHFTQARRLGFWELGGELMGLETNLRWSAPWLMAFWVPRDCRLQGNWLLELEFQPA